MNIVSDNPVMAVKPMPLFDKDVPEEKWGPVFNNVNEHHGGLSRWYVPDVSNA